MRLVSSRLLPPLATVQALQLVMLALDLYSCACVVCDARRQLNSQTCTAYDVQVDNAKKCLVSASAWLVAHTATLLLTRQLSSDSIFVVSTKVTLKPLKII